MFLATEEIFYFTCVIALILYLTACFSCVSGLTDDELEPGEEVDQLPRSELLNIVAAYNQFYTMQVSF